MTFKHVFWEDAMEIKNAQDGFRLLFIVISTFTSVLLMFGPSFEKSFEQIAPSSASLFIFLVVLFLLGLSFYINTSLQGLDLTDAWANEGTRDGRYWTEHLFLGMTMFFSIFLFFESVFKYDIFSTDGVFNASELLIELPLVYFMFAILTIGSAYIMFCIVLLVIQVSLYFVQKEEPFVDKKRELLYAWEACDAREKEQLVGKMNLVEQAVKWYPRLTRKQKEAGKAVIDDMFDYLIQECQYVSKKKNLLK